MMRTVTLCDGPQGTVVKNTSAGVTWSIDSEHDRWTFDARTAAVLALGEEVLRLYKVDQQQRTPAEWYAIESGNGWSDRSNLSRGIVRTAIDEDARAPK